MTNYKRKGFKRTFVFVLLAALIVAGGAVLYWWSVSQRLYQDARVVLDSVGTELAENVRNELSSQQKILTTLAVSLRDDSVLQNQKELVEYLQEQNEQSQFALSGFQFADGRTIFSNGKTQNRFLSKELVKEILEKKFVISYRTSSPFQPDQESLLLAAMVPNRETAAGIVFAVQPTSYYQFALEDFLLTDTSLSLVIDQQGDVLMSHPKASQSNTFKVLDDATAGKRSSKEAMYRDIKEGRGGVFGYFYDGKQRFLSYYPIGYNGWYAIAILPVVSIAQKIKSLIILSLVVCLSIISVLGVLLVFILRQQRHHSRALYKIGFVDPLTGKDNINAFQLKFATAVQRFKEQQRQFALVLININSFKAVNNIYGFEKGDKVLRQVGKTLKSSLTEDELFCRSDSDVFLLLVNCPSREELGKRLETLAQRATKLCQVEKESIPISFTCGVYVVDEAVPFFMMLDRANLAWTSAKKQAGGGLYAFYDSEHLKKIITEKRIESSMEQALQERQFKVYYQPKYDFKTGRIVSAEALVRWQHPEQGMIRPDWFIPVFERNGFVRKLDMYILQEVAALQRRRREANLSVVPIGVNFSRLHLDDLDFLDNLLQIVEDNHLPHDLIEVELTESMVMDDVLRMTRVLDELHIAGFSVAMDDFGSGYSSLNVLKELEFDCVKLDKEFLSKGEGNERMRQIVSGLVKMIKEVGSKIVAEGVETKEQARFLRSIGCDMAQGYLYSRPLPAEDFEQKLTENAEVDIESSYPF